MSLFSDATQKSLFAGNEVYGGHGAVSSRGSLSGGTHIIKDNIVKAGYLYGGQSYGGGGTGIEDTLIITNNTQIGNWYGIGLSSKQYKNIIIDENRFSNLTSRGIDLAFTIDGVNLKICNNTFKNINNCAIYVNGNNYKNGPVKVQDNTLIDVYPSNPNAGITLKNIQNTIISGNLIFKFPVASFSAFPTSGYAPLPVKFTDKSIGSPTSWRWSFGDGTYSTQKNPSHIYSKVGKYTVSLTVKNIAGNKTVTKSSLIVVNCEASNDCLISFFLNGQAPLTDKLTENSTNNPTYNIGTLVIKLLT